MRGQAFTAAAALAAALATAAPAAAQPYSSYHDEHVAQQERCQRARDNNTAAGAVIGGVAGAVLGSQAGSRGHRTDGSLLGAVAGAVAGGAIARTSTRCDSVPEGSYDPYDGRPYGQQYGDRRYDQYGERPYDDGSGLEGGPYQPSGYRDGYGGDCRMGDLITRDAYGRERRESVEMCRGADGVYRPR